MAKPNMADMFKQAQKMQDDMARIQQSLEGMTVEGSAGGDMVTVQANGKQKILSVHIEPDAVSDDTEMLEDLIVAATNQALEKASDLAQTEMKKVAGGLLGNIPGGLKIPGLS